MHAVQYSLLPRQCRPLHRHEHAPLNRYLYTSRRFFLGINILALFGVGVLSASAQGQLDSRSQFLAIKQKGRGCAAHPTNLNLLNLSKDRNYKTTYKYFCFMNFVRGSLAHRPTPNQDQHHKPRLVNPKLILYQHLQPCWCNLRKFYSWCKPDPTKDT